MPSSKNVPEGAALIHRELLQLIVLILVAIGAFFVTRAVAINNRELSVQNASEWYRRGQQFAQEGRPNEAIDAFRRATVRNRTNRTYVLALSAALAQAHDYDSARSILLTLRESAPEDAEINLTLARLSAERHDVTEAIRFFHDALYAPWPPERAQERRGVRVELVRFLLAHNQSGRAESELLAAAADMPDDLANHVELAELFGQAGDDRNALVHFQRALRLAPQSNVALTGAGTAAFHLGQYPLARQYLHNVTSDTEAVREIRQVADLVMSRDPAEARIGARERRRRLDTNLSYVEQRLAACISVRGAQSSLDKERALEDELQTFTHELESSVTLDQDTIESGVDLIDRIEDAVKSCGAATAVDQALILIARQHGVASQ